MRIKSVEVDSRLSYHLALVVLSSAFVVLMPELLLAGPTPSAAGGYMCVIANNFTGNAGRGIATIGISVIGVLALVGRVTWTQAMIVGAGVAALASVPSIVGSLGASIDC